MITLPRPERTSALVLPEAATVLVVLLGGLGEALLAEPLVQALGARYPGARLHLLTRNATRDLVGRLPGLASVVALPADLDTTFSHAFLMQNLWRFMPEFKALRELKADLALAPAFCRDLLTDAAILASGAPCRVGWDGGTDADADAAMGKTDARLPSEALQRTFFYTHFLDAGGAPPDAWGRCVHFVRGLGLATAIQPPSLTPSDEAFAEADRFLADRGLDGVIGEFFGWINGNVKRGFRVHIAPFARLELTQRRERREASLRGAPHALLPSVPKHEIPPREEGIVPAFFDVGNQMVVPEEPGLNLGPIPGCDGVASCEEVAPAIEGDGVTRLP